MYVCICEQSMQLRSINAIITAISIIAAICYLKLWIFKLNNIPSPRLSSPDVIILSLSKIQTLIQTFFFVALNQFVVYSYLGILDEA